MVHDFFNYKIVFFMIGYKNTTFLFFFFWYGLRDPIACSLLGGGIPSQNSDYKVTRLCLSIILSCYL